MNTKKVIGTFLLIVWVIPFNAIAQQPANILSEQQQAFADAKRDAQKTNTTIWVLAGCLLHVWAVAGAYAITPSVPTARLIGKSPEYVAFYSDTYKNKLKHKRVSAAIGGCCMGTVAYAAFGFVFIQANNASPFHYRY